MKYKYGEIVLESKDFKEFRNTMMNLSTKGYKIGDWPLRNLNTELCTYCIIVNDDNYLDVEYRVPVNETRIITESELTRGFPWVK
mgnify:CR=1 FL=1